MKEIIKFLNSTSNINCSLSTSGDRIQLILDEIPDETTMKSGFYLLNEHNYYIQGDYSEYKYIYKIDTDTKTVILTKNADDIYTESTTDSSTNTTEPSTELTDEEKAAIALAEFNEAKTSKIEEMSDDCQNAIENGVDVNGKHYSYTLQDQSNIMTVMTMAKQSGMDVPYHADGESCSLYTYKQICTIQLNESMNVTMQQTYFNQLKLYIQSLSDVSGKEIVDGIYYGIPLTGTYLEAYNNIIDQSTAIMTAITSVSQEV